MGKKVEKVPDSLNLLVLPERLGDLRAGFLSVFNVLMLKVRTAEPLLVEEVVELVVLTGGQGGAQLRCALLDSW